MTPLPRETVSKDETKARHVGLQQTDDFEQAPIVEPPAPPAKAPLRERLRKEAEETRHPPEY